MATSTTSSAYFLLIPTLNPMTTTTQPIPSTRLALAACPTPLRCPEPCQTCTGVAQSVAAELAQLLRQRHGSSQVADWLDGFTHPGDER